jgi:F0F1-type ATP synthase membrane subunit b/b'
MTVLLSDQNWANVATIIVALCVLAGTYLTGRFSRSATDRSSEVQSQANEIQGQAQVVDNYSQLLTDMRVELNDLRAQQVKDREQATREREQDRDRIAKLEKRAASAEQRYGRAISYIRILLAWITQHLPDVQPPPVPAAIAQDLDQ